LALSIPPADLMNLAAATIVSTVTAPLLAAEGFFRPGFFRLRLALLSWTAPSSGVLACASRELGWLC
jgi:hypothetical protein